MSDLAEQIHRLARETGFARAAFVSASEALPTERYRNWLERGYHADMTYLAANLPQRFGPDVLVGGAKTVICLAVAYAPPEDASRQPGSGALLVARYARGRDYHRVLKNRCLKLMDKIRELVPGFEGRAFVDGAPIMERSLAAAAGLGWIGKNGCLIVPGLGSYAVLAEIVCNLTGLPFGQPMENLCGQCRACLENCPTGALPGDGLADARRCVSYLTLEHSGPIKRELWERMGTRLCGCDRCQEVCPHNRNLSPGDVELTSLAPLGGASLADVLSWDVQAWDAATRGSACRRADLSMFLRNAVIAAGNSNPAGEHAPALQNALALLAERRDDLRELIDWALRALQRGGISGGLL